MDDLPEQDSFEARFDWLKAHAHSGSDRSLLDQIRADRSLVLTTGSLPPDEWLPPLRVQGLRVRLPRRSAPASLDSLTEHLRDRVHARAAGFTAEDAGVVVDVGANEGIYAACRFAENASLRMILVEPVPRTFSVLIETLLRNRSVSSPGGESSFAAVRGLAGDLPCVRQAGSDLLEYSPQVSTIASRSLTSKGPRWAKSLATATLRCPVISIDMLCGAHGVEDIDVLKVDAEGDELQVLAGSRQILRRTRRVVVEFHGRRNAAGCRNLLESSGFRIVHVDESPVGDMYAVSQLQDGDKDIADRRADK